jgi:SecD/SecF fusion protein
MSRGLQFKLILILFLAAWALFELFPTFQYWPLDKDQRQTLQLSDNEQFKWLQAEAIKRGLDLQGGVFLVLEVDPRNTMEGGELVDAVEGARRVIEQRVNQYGVSEANIQKIGMRRLIIELPGLEDITAAMNLVGRTALLRFNLLRPISERDEVLRRIDAAVPRLVAAVYGDSIYTFNEPEQDFETTSESETAATEDVASGSPFDAAPGDEVESPFGGTEPSDEAVEVLAEDESAAHPFAGVRSLSELLQSGPSGDYYVAMDDRPKVDELLLMVNERASELVPKNGEFLFGKPEVFSGRLLIPLFYVNVHPELTGASVEEARVGKGSDLELSQAGRSVINFSVKSDSIRKFSSITRRNRGERLAIILDNVVYSAPVIQAHITDGRSVITGMEDREEARGLAIAIRSGALPAEVEVQEQRYVGPSLGADSIASSQMALSLGGILVILFILAYYRLAGGVAIFGLAINMLLLLASLAGLHGTLTLPGVAGLLLTIGMAVDANVLIFERIREELATGKTARSAIEAGYDRAATAIWDANITTFMTAAVLYQFGTGPIRGFALILGIGIFSSVFTALFVTRAIYELWLTGRTVRDLSIGKSFISNTSMPFMSMAKIWLIVSSVLLSLGIVIMVAFGFNLGVDFAGGTRLEVRFHPPVSVSDVRASLREVQVGDRKLDLTRSEIKTVDQESDILITVKQFPDIDAADVDAALRGHLEASFPQNLDGNWLLGTEVVGPKIGSELKKSAIYAIVASLLGILIYLSFRFEWVFAVAATAALFHDVIFTLGIFSLIRHEITLAVVASVLTIVGYSLNDTIVVFDRIREGLKNYRRLSYSEVLDRSINETLSRTLITSGTTLMVVVSLYLLAGDVLKDFALALIVGILVGTYSSIYIASALVMVWHNRRERLESEAGMARAQAAKSSARGRGAKTTGK